MDMGIANNFRFFIPEAGTVVSSHVGARGPTLQVTKLSLRKVTWGAGMGLTPNLGSSSEAVTWPLSVKTRRLL